MLHTADDFLTAITAQPTDRTLRLVYADWLDERADPRAELVRVEEEMRELPVFGDRFWELKPRRNELRALAGAEWCGRLRYGTECEPVFRHGIPDGWRERWRLIREFTERWHRVPMGDVGGRQFEIFQPQHGVGRTLPPSVWEWVTFARDAGAGESSRGLQSEDYLSCHDEFEAIALQMETDWSGYSYSAVRYEDLGQPDPPLYSYLVGFGSSTPGWRGDVPCPTSAFFLWHVLDYFANNRWGVGGPPGGTFHSSLDQPDDELARRLSAAFPVQVQFMSCEMYEADNILVRLDSISLWVQVFKPLDPAQIPDFLWPYARAASHKSGMFRAV